MAEAPAAGAFDLPATVFLAEVLEVSSEAFFFEPFVDEVAFLVVFVDVDLLLVE